MRKRRKRGNRSQPASLRRTTVRRFSWKATVEKLRRGILLYSVLTISRSLPIEMDIDTSAKSSKAKKGKTIIKRRGKRSNIVFPKFGDKKAIRKKTK